MKQRQRNKRERKGGSVKRVIRRLIEILEKLGLKDETIKEILKYILD